MDWFFCESCESYESIDKLVNENGDHHVSFIDIDADASFNDMASILVFMVAPVIAYNYVATAVGGLAIEWIHAVHTRVGQ